MQLTSTSSCHLRGTKLVVRNPTIAVSDWVCVFVRGDGKWLHNCLHMLIGVCVCVCVSVCAHMHACMWCVWVCVVCVCMWVCIHVHVCGVCVCVWVHMGIYTHAYVCGGWLSYLEELEERHSRSTLVITGIQVTYDRIDLCRCVHVCVKFDP